MKTPEQWADEVPEFFIGDRKDRALFAKLFAQAIADARHAARDELNGMVRAATLAEVLREAERFAAGHHFAGDKAGEASFRRFMDRIREMSDNNRT